MSEDDAPMDSPKVLLVDDEPYVLDLLLEVLDSEQVEVMATTSPLEALKLLGEQAFAVVMSDVRMPVMDGTQLLAKAQQVSPDTVRLILTGHADMHMAVQAINVDHVFRFLEKPWKNENIRVAIRQAVSRYNLVTENCRLLTLTEQQNDELKELNQGLEKKVAERTRELQEAKETAEIANRVKTEFLSNVGHELRTPMNIIMGMTDVVLSTDPDPDANRYLQRIKSASTSLLHLVDDILEVAQLEAQNRELKAEDFALQGSLESVHYHIQNQTEEKDLDLVWEVQSEIPRTLVGNAAALIKVLDKLLGNAIKFTEAGQVSLRISCLHRDADTIHLQFEIEDTGRGIPKEQQRVIFNAFVQADGSATRLHEGAGLGLTIAAKLVRLLGGRLDLESEEGKGTRLWFDVKFKISELSR